MLVVRNRKLTLWIVSILLLTMVLVIKIGFARGQSDEAQIAFNRNNLIRLHVVANSDSPQDQGLKLRVRDAVLEASGGLLQGTTEMEEAWDILKDNLDVLKDAANQRILAEGRDYPVEVELGEYPFPTKTYGNFVLAAGTYPAVRVTMGAGSGHNWWCVLFPPLCFLNMSGPLAQDRVQVEKDQAVAQGETQVKLEFKRPLDLPVTQVPVVTPGLSVK